MPTVMRWQVSVYRPTDLPRDWITNTFYLHETLGDPFEEPGWSDLAQDIAELWSTFRPYPQGYSRVTVKGYNMADSKPRRPKTTLDFTHGNTNSTDPGPHEVACCLSFSSAKNTPRERGRIYIGPWGTPSMTERPGSTVWNQLRDLAEGLEALGGVNVDWSVHSETGAGSTVAVERWWIDDEWDTQRRRGLKPQQRTQGTTSENSP